MKKPTVVLSMPPDATYTFAVGAHIEPFGVVTAIDHELGNVELRPLGWLEHAQRWLWRVQSWARGLLRWA